MKEITFKVPDGMDLEYDQETGEIKILDVKEKILEELACQLIHDISYEYRLGEDIGFYDKKKEVILEYFHKLTDK